MGKTMGKTMGKKGEFSEFMVNLHTKMMIVYDCNNVGMVISMGKNHDDNDRF